MPGAIVVFALLLIAATPASGAGGACSFMGASPDMRGCSSAAVSKPSFLCGPPELDGDAKQSHRNFNLSQLLGCANNVQNCACALIGARNCDSIDASGKIVLYERPGADGLKLRRNESTGEIEILLDQATARRVSDAATYTNDREIDKLKLEAHNDLYRLTTAVALLNASQRFADTFVAATTPEDSLPQSIAARDLAIQSLWQEIEGQLQACHAVDGTRSGSRTPKSKLELLRGNLLCSLRSTSRLADHRVYARWPGCACDHGQGRMIEGTQACVTSESHVERFTELPVDERLPGLIGRFVTLLERRSGYKVKNIGVLGCGFERFEEGPTVKGLGDAPPEERVLRARHVSDHARGTACDLAYVTFKLDDCSEWTFRAANGFKAVPNDPRVTNFRYPFYQALVEYLRARKMDPGQYLDGQRLIVRSGASSFYRRLESEFAKVTHKSPRDASFGPKDDAVLQLKLGAMVRDSLVEAGFVVYDPTTNAVHHSHFHFEIPADERDLALLATPVDQGKENVLRARDVLENAYLRSAAGLDKATVPEDSRP